MIVNTHVMSVPHLTSVLYVLEIESLMKKPENVIAQLEHMKLDLNTVQLVITNVKLVKPIPTIVLHVLMKTELIMDFAHVMMDIGMTEPINVNLVMNSVKLVLEQEIIVSFVLMDMMAHHLVHGSQSPNQLKLKTYQLDLLKSHIVMIDVKLVHKMKMTV